jgi:hypothetical protein
MAAIFSVAAKSAAHTALMDLIETAGAAKCRLHDASNTLLAEIILAGGVINGSTGQLTFAMDTREDSAPASGMVSYGVITDNTNVEYIRLDAAQGTTPVDGFIVVNTLDIVSGAPVELISMTVG